MDKKTSEDIYDEMAERVRRRRQKAERNFIRLTGSAGGETEREVLKRDLSRGKYQKLDSIKDSIEKKVTKLKNTKNKKVQKKAKGGMIIGPAYRHGHKDYRNGGVPKRTK